MYTYLNPSNPPRSFARRVCALLVLGLLTLRAPVCFGEGLAHTVRAAPVKAQPDHSAATLVTLDTGTDVIVGERSGAWFRVYLGDQLAGWIHLLAVRYYPATASGSLLDAADKATRSKTTVSIGVRGLDQKMLAESQPNHARLQRLLAFGYSPAGAREFAAEAQLRAREESYP